MLKRTLRLIACCTVFLPYSPVFAQDNLLKETLEVEPTEACGDYRVQCVCQAYGTGFRINSALYYQGNFVKEEVLASNLTKEQCLDFAINSKQCG